MASKELGLCETMLGKEHPDTLTSMSNLGAVLRDQNKYEQTEEMHRQALRLREKVLGKEHPDTLSSMRNLATVLRDQDKYEQTEEILRQTLQPQYLRRLAELEHRGHRRCELCDGTQLVNRSGIDLCRSNEQLLTVKPVQPRKMSAL